MTQSKEKPSEAWTAQEWTAQWDAVPEGHTQITVYREGDGRRVATVFEDPAYASAIAAVPDMKAALESVKEWMEDCLLNRGVRGLPSRVQYDAVCDAINKANETCERKCDGW